jgi:hypothetical protein
MHQVVYIYIYYFTKHFLSFERFFRIQLSKYVFIFFARFFIVIYSLVNFLLEDLKKLKKHF